MGLRLSRRSLLKAGARLGAGAGLALLGLGKGAGQTQDVLEDEGPYFHESATKLTLGNWYYEVDFDNSNGAITRIFDKRGGGVVSEGNAEGSLWGLAQGGWVDQYGHNQRMEDRLQSGRVPDSGFDWNWDSESRTLTFDYELRSVATSVSVRATVTAGVGPYFDLGISISNRGSERLDWIDVPHRLEFKVNNIERALLPYYYTGGIMLDKSVFQEKRSSHTVYYPNMEADLMWIEMSQGSLATYALFGESSYWQSLPQFEYRDAPDGTVAQWRHAFAIALESDNTADLPVMRICVGEPPVKTLQRWRTDNGIDKFPGSGRSWRTTTRRFVDLLRLSQICTAAPAGHFRRKYRQRSAILMHPQYCIRWSCAKKIMTHLDTSRTGGRHTTGLGVERTT